jgi:hypothetical protein
VPIKKPSGEIGVTRLTISDGGQHAELIPVPLPTDKEGLERYFADRFLAKLNATPEYGATITIKKQSDTSDLDFIISGSTSRYLELAEIAPYSEEFGKSALQERSINVYEYSKWIWTKIILKKQNKYGSVCGNTMLLLYVTRWEFLLSELVKECLVWTLQAKGCLFHSVYLLHAGGDDLNLVDQLHRSSKTARAARHFKECEYFNLNPHRFTIAAGSKS